MYFLWVEVRKKEYEEKDLKTLLLQKHLKETMQYAFFPSYTYTHK